MSAPTTPRYYGKYRAKVVDTVIDTDNPDAAVNHIGLLVVKVPDVFGPDATVVAEPCLPYGHFFVPPVDTDLWVEFEAADPIRPVWVGVWYPPGTTPVEAEVSPPERRVIKTTAGHTVEIVDTDGKEQILVRHASDAFLSMDHDGGVLLYNPKGSHVHLDAANEAATFVEGHGNNIAMGEDGVAVVNNKGAMINITGDTVHISAAKIVLDATNVAVGAGGSQQIALGAGLTALWTALLAHTHLSTAPGIPTGLVTVSTPPTLPHPLIPGVDLASSAVIT
jgi:hypothetical protein